MYIPLLTAVIVSVPVAVAAQAASPPLPARPGSTVVLRLPSAPAPGPYSKLFSGEARQGPDGGQWRVVPPEPGQNGAIVQQPRTKVVCGMTLILIDPGAVDPEMTKPLPNDGTRYTMRGFPAPACRDR